MDFKNVPTDDDDDDDAESSEETAPQPPISITDAALRLVSGTPATWVAYTPQKEEGRIPTSRAEASMLLEAIDIAVQKMAASSQSYIKKCQVCGSTDATKLKACSRCKLVWYCGRECQVAVRIYFLLLLTFLTLGLELVCSQEGLQVRLTTANNHIIPLVGVTSCLNMNSVVF